MPAIIDTHIHFWDLDRFKYPWLAPDNKTLARNFLPHHLEPILQRAGVSGVIIVQALGELIENDWSLYLAGKNKWIAGVVGWLDPLSPQVPQILAKYKKNPRFVGVRLGINKQFTNEGGIRRELVQSLRAIAAANLTCDVLVNPENLILVRTIADAIPDLTIVVNHVGNPPIRSRQLEEWAGRLRTVAEFPNVNCKISGMVTLCDPKTWTPEDLKPVVDVAIDAFGYERLMYGSDWPVCQIAAPYQDVLDATKKVLSPHSAADKAHIFWETAQRVYRLRQG